MQSENDISAPEHLNKAFFETALQNGLREQRIFINEIKFSLGSADGENYLSQIYRVSLAYSKTPEQQDNFQNISVIVKVLPSNENLDFMDDINVFNKEKWLLMEILPQFEILVNDVQFGPRCHYVESSPVRTFVLQDMKSLGFKMEDRVTGLDEPHTTLSLKKLGQFHAISMVYARKRPSMMSHYNKGLIDPSTFNPSTTLYKIFHKHLRYEVKLASGWNGYEKITRKLQEFYDDFESRILTCQRSKDRDIKVLNHGDFWVNNLLFKYDSKNKPVDLVFIDFQLSTFASLGIDLNYFFFASVQMDVLKNWKTLLKTYHGSLRDTLIELSYSEIPTYEDIVREFKAKSAYGFFTILGPLPVMTMDKNLSEGNSFDSLAESEEKTNIIFGSKNLIDRLKYSLLELDKMGALDVV